MGYVMQGPAEYRKYAEECERMAKDGPREHRSALLKIAEAWRQCALDAERKDKKAPPIAKKSDEGELKD